MHNVALKQKATELRERGRSIQEIASQLQISKSTVSHWCKNIQLSEATIQSIASRGQRKLLTSILQYAENQRKARIERIKQYREEGFRIVKTINDRDLLMAGLGLYWGEGYKESNGELGFTNSNPLIIKFYIRWLALFGVTKEDLIFRLTINKTFYSKAQDIKKFWIDFLKVDDSQFSKTTLIQTQLKKASLKRDEKYKGILRVKVRKGLALKYRILGAIEYLSDSS